MNNSPSINQVIRIVDYAKTFCVSTGTAAKMYRADCAAIARIYGTHPVVRVHLVLSDFRRLYGDIPVRKGFTAPRKKQKTTKTNGKH
jgi:hypothetical protein